MGGRLQLQVPTLRSESTRPWEREVIHIFTGSNTPRPRTPTPRYRHLLWRGRGRLTTHGIHLTYPSDCPTNPDHLRFGNNILGYLNLPAQRIE